MKQLLATLLLLSIPVFARADSVEWSTYCDGNFEKVKCALTVHAGAAVDADWCEMSAINNEDCLFAEGAGVHISHATSAEDLGGGNVRITWQGWLRSYLTVSRPAFYGTYWIVVPDEVTGEPRHYPHDFDCREFESTFIVDNSECNTLPVAVSTWGAVKALYRVGP